MLTFFWVCFILGLALCAVSLLFGELGSHVHLGGHHFDLGGHHGADFGGHDVGGGHHGAGGADNGGSGVSILNYSSLVMFMTWFGGVGVILMEKSRLSLVFCVLGAVVAGLIGATIMFLFLAKILLKNDHMMRERDYYVPGTLARVTSLIREGGTGEIVYVQGGTRKTTGARSEEGASHKQGEEVVIVRYEKGIAYVKSVGDELSSL